MNRNHTVTEKIYASLLGKCIGVRLGAPIEGMGGPLVRKGYAPVRSYLLDYGQFAADDDINGPLFFPWVLKDHPIAEVTAEEMGDWMRNIISDGTGFFWWGGEDIATEHRAYANLKKGIKAPASGSRETNGIVLAEQIGGQIFSDCWGWMSLGNIEEAAELARKMSSVTHDGDGIQGGIFVASAVAAAWNSSSIREVIEKAYSMLDPGSGYAAMVREVSEFHKAHQNPEDCLKWIEETKGYDHYPGACHILPNTAILLYGLLYGDGDFNGTMRLIAEAGCDTDCNLGNAGSILGMMLGLDGMDPCWITPFEDMILCSSSLGSHNLSHLSAEASRLADLALSLHGKQPEHAENFSLPYGTLGYSCENPAVLCSTDHGRLRITLTDLPENSTVMVRTKTYMRPEDVYDCRYQPQFTAILEPGDQVHYDLERNQVPIQVIPYIKDRNNRIFASDQTSAACAPILETGLLIRALKPVRGDCFYVNHVIVSKHPSYVLDFGMLQNEDRGPQFGGGRWITLENLMLTRGEAFYEHGLLMEAGSEVNFSNDSSNAFSLTLKWEAEHPDFIFCTHWEGMLRKEGVHITEHGVSLFTQHDDSIQETELIQAEIHSGYLRISDGEIAVVSEGNAFRKEVTIRTKHGPFGIWNHSGILKVLACGINEEEDHA